MNCSQLPGLSNGTITYSSAMQIGSSFEAKTTATYSCLTGFSLTGGDIVRFCEGHPAGLWNGTAPTCNGNTYNQVLTSLKNV